VWGKWRQSVGTLIRLHSSKGGWPPAGYDVAAHRKGGSGGLSVWRKEMEVGGSAGPNGLVTLAASRENGRGPQEGMGRNQQWAAKILFTFKKDLSSKIQILSD
jgi:hypothetical protein